MTLTTEAVLALAPDDSSAKAARGLNAPAKWPLLGANETAAWGECQGSGSKPYQTQVDLSGPAFKCSCPSRKFPCKHGLALLLIRAQNASLFKADEPPAWVAQWLATRQEKAQKKEVTQQAKAAQLAEQADSPELAQAAAATAAARSAQREAQRWGRITQAGAELQRWLADQAGRGLGALNPEVIKTWQSMAARMVDAQAPGLGARVREAADGVQQGADWPERTLQRLGLLQLACEALQRRESLPPALQADLRTVVGWPLDKDEVLAQGEAVSDEWTVLATVTEERDNKLNERRVWLQGAHTGRRALLLDHAFSGRGFESAWWVGQVVQARLTYFPGGLPLRALALDVVQQQSSPHWPRSAWGDEWASLAARTAANPWVGAQPLLLSDAVVLRQGDAMWAVAAAEGGGRAVALQLGDDFAWTLLATTGGQPCHLFGEWDGRVLQPLSAWAPHALGRLWHKDKS